MQSRGGSALEYGGQAIMNDQRQYSPPQRFEMPVKSVTPNMNKPPSQRITPQMTPGINAHREYHNLSSLEVRDPTSRPNNNSFVSNL